MIASFNSIYMKLPIIYSGVLKTADTDCSIYDGFALISSYANGYGLAGIVASVVTAD